MLNHFRRLATVTVLASVVRFFFFFLNYVRLISTNTMLCQKRNFVLRVKPRAANHSDRVGVADEGVKLAGNMLSMLSEKSNATRDRATQVMCDFRSGGIIGLQTDRSCFSSRIRKNHMAEAC